MKILLGLLLIFIPSFLSAQIIKGKVTDSLNTAIPFANVILKDSEKSSIIDYTYTDNLGTYSFSIKNPGNYILSFTAMTYKVRNISIVVDSLDSKLEYIHNITLASSPFQLKEVIVNADMPIIQKQDTIDIKVKTFLKGSEEVVEDILKSLPGIEVSKDGSIRVQGKSVKKVLIEGDDLFDKGYKLLTKNLSADVVDKVQILNKYNDNVLLKNISDSDDIALNILLKEDVKNTLFGTIQLGYGTDQFYENKLNLIDIRKKTKYYLFGNLNNIGNDATGDIYQLIYPNFLSEEAYIGDNISAMKNVDLVINKPNLDDDRTNFNNAELISFNAIYNPTNKMKIKGFGFFTSDENSFFQSSTEEFILEPNDFTNNQSIELLKRNIVGSGKLDLLYNFNKSFQLDYTGKYSVGDFKDNSRRLFNNDQTNENLNSKTEYVDQRLTLTKKVSDNKALQLTARYIYDEKPQDYSINTFLYQALFPTAMDIIEVRQNSTGSVNFFGLEASYYLNSKGNNLNIRAGYTQSENKLMSELLLINDSNEIVDTGEEYTNNYVNLTRDLYLISNYKYSTKKISIRTTLDLHQFHSSILNYGFEENIKPLLLIPSTAFTWKINKKNNLLFSYRYSSNFTSAIEGYQGFVLNNFRLFKKGLGTLTKFNGSTYLASYNLGNWTDSFLINTSFIYNSDNKYLGSNSEISPNYILSSPILLKNRNFYSLNISADKFIESISSNVKLKSNLSNSSFENIINNSELRQIKTSTFSLGAEFRTVFTGLFNFHLGSTWTNSKVTTTLKSTNIDNYSFLDFYLNISDKFNFQLENERYYFGNLTSNKSFVFSDFSSQYIVKENKLKFKFIIKNIFNTSSFSNFSINDTGSYNSSYRLLPRYFMLRLDYRF